MQLHSPFRKPKASWLRKLVSKMSSRKQVKGEYIETVRYFSFSFEFVLI